VNIDINGDKECGSNHELCLTCVQKGVNLDMVLTMSQSVLRLGFALASGSMALMAQGIYSIADSLTKIMNYVSIKISKAPPSTLFPYGYGKIQFVTSMILGAALIFGAVNFLISNVHHANDSVDEIPSGLALIGILLSGIISASSSYYLNCVSTQTKNPVMKAASLDNRIDAISSGTVFIGVLASRSGWPAADNWTAILVALMVVWIGGSIAYESIHGLMDISIPQESLHSIRRAARMTPGVIKVEYCRGRMLGDTWQISMQVAIDDRLSSIEVHQITLGIRQNIKSDYNNVSFIQISTTPMTVDLNDGQEFAEIINAFSESNHD
jgi:cation diffusion facilitator family transporter